MPSDFVGDEGFAILATPQMLDTLSSALFVEFDVTYDEIKGLRYLAHAVTFNHLLMTFQPVAKILMSRITSGAYGKAIRKLLELTTNFHPEFENGKNLAAWQVDYSLAQRDGIEANIGDNGFILGCKIHFQRGTTKIVDKVCSDAHSQMVWKKIAWGICELQNREDVLLAFDILCAKIALDDPRAVHFLEESFHLTQQQLDQVDSSKWGMAENYCAWWSKPKVVKMYTKAFSDLTDAEWELFRERSNTNAVESHNRLSHASNSTSAVVKLDDWYRQAKKVCYQHLAAEQGVQIGQSQQKRKENNAKRRKKDNQPKVVVAEEEDADITAPTKRRRGRPPGGATRATAKPVAEKRPVVSTSQTPTRAKSGVTENEATSSDHSVLPQDENTSQATRVTRKRARIENGAAVSNQSAVPQDEKIGKSIWVFTTTGRGNKKKDHGWCEAVINDKKSNGIYIATYKKWPKVNAEIEDLDDEECVRMINPN